MFTSASIWARVAKQLAASTDNAQFLYMKNKLGVFVKLEFNNQLEHNVTKYELLSICLIMCLIVCLRRVVCLRLLQARARATTP